MPLGYNIETISHLVHAITKSYPLNNFSFCTSVKHSLWKQGNTCKTNRYLRGAHYQASQCPCGELNPSGQ